MEIVVRFQKSHSKNFGRALELARRLPQYSPPHQDTPEHVVTIQTSDLLKYNKLLQELVGIVLNWKGALLLIDGAPRPQDFRLLAHVTACAENAQFAPNLHEYCSHSSPWNCHQLKGISGATRYDAISQNYRNTPGWFNWGQWIEIGRRWHVDKKRLFKSLQYEMKQNCLMACPNFKVADLWQAIQNLPDEIDLSTSDLFEVRYEERYKGGELIRGPVGIKLKPLNPFDPDALGLGSDISGGEL